MKRIMTTTLAFTLLVPASMALPVVGPVASAEARDRDRDYRDNDRRGHRYREWRGRDGRTYCRKNDGTTGLVVGALGGALLGRTIDTRGDRTVGTLLGAAAGGVAGREIDRGGDRRRCR